MIWLTPCLLAANGGVHTLDDSVDGIASHYNGVMLQDAVDIETLCLKVLNISMVFLGKINKWETTI